jgi:dipeptidyl aminopeptidase/acylaminoacyl peptidase
MVVMMMIRNKRLLPLFCILAGIITVNLIGCAKQASVSPPESPHSVLSSSTPTPMGAVSPTPINTPTLYPTLLPTASPSPTPTYPPYEGEPFTVVFLRGGNLWLSEIGGKGEHQLTTESDGWFVQEYAVSPRGDRIAYVAFQSPPQADALIKQVDVSTGSVSVLTGENDPYLEYSVGWLDSEHITFSLGEFMAPGYTKETPAWDGFEPFHHIVFNLTTGERTFVPESLVLSQSPDGRYWLACSREYAYTGPCDYKLHDLVTGEEWTIAENIGWGTFVDWSPDSEILLFTAFEDPNDLTVQLVAIDAATRQERVITSDSEAVIEATWSPNDQMIAFARCSPSEDPWPFDDCGLWLMSPDGSDRRRVLATGSLEPMHPDWTPDGSRIVFAAYDENVLTSWTVWSITVDGGDLRPIVSNASSRVGPTVLCNP